MTLGQRITIYRGALHLSQQELGEHLNVSRQSISKWETDASIPELSKLVEMSALFSISLDMLATGTETTATTPSVQPRRDTQKTFAFILLAIGLFCVVLGVFSLLSLFIGFYFVATSAVTFFSKHNPLLKITGVTLFLILLCSFSFTGISLSSIFVPASYTQRSHTQLAIAYFLCTAIFLWVFCAMKSPYFKHQKWLAIGIGANLVVCQYWPLVLRCLINRIPLSDLSPSALLHFIISVFVPICITIIHYYKRKNPIP